MPFGRYNLIALTNDLNQAFAILSRPNVTTLQHVDYRKLETSFSSDGVSSDLENYLKKSRNMEQANVFLTNSSLLVALPVHPHVQG